MHRMFLSRRLLPFVGSLPWLCAGSNGVEAQSSAGNQDSTITVTREEPVITRTEFDPRRPPANMPKLTPPESGACDTTFELGIGVGYSLEVPSPTTVNLWIDELDITTRLKINIFTQAGAPAKLRAHEEGHRQISEHYYREAEASVRAAARPLIGRMFAGVGADRKAAEQDAMRQITVLLEQGYMNRTRLRSIVANERFDEITEHGLSSLDEAEAIAIAIDAQR